MRKGFTLIELLVVIAIVGILSSLTIYSIGNSRNRAEDVHRKNNARTIHSATMQYKIDREQYPQALTGSTLEDVKNSNALSPYLGTAVFGKYLNNTATNARFSSYLWYNNQPTAGVAQAWALAYQGETSLGTTPAHIDNLTYYGIYKSGIYGAFQLVQNPCNGSLCTPFVDLVMNPPDDPYGVSLPPNSNIFVTWGL